MSKSFLTTTLRHVDFCIRHVYSSTIADVLKEQEALEAKLKATKK